MFILWIGFVNVCRFLRLFFWIFCFILIGRIVIFVFFKYFIFCIIVCLLCNLLFIIIIVICLFLLWKFFENFFWILVKVWKSRGCFFFCFNWVILFINWLFFIFGIMFILLVIWDLYRMILNFMWFGDILYCVGIDVMKVILWRKLIVDMFFELFIINIILVILL